MRLALLSFVLLMNSLPAQAADKRPMTIDDLFAFKRVTDPQVSPDGKLVAYVVTTVDLAGNKSSSNLWLAATDRKTSPRQLTTTTKKDRHPRWNQEGTRILFESNRSGTNQLWVIDLSGGEAQQVTTISTNASTGIWSPDGKKLAFVSSVYPEFSTLPYAESDKKNKEKLEAIEKSPVKAKVFSKLFFRHWDEYVEDKRQHLFVCNVDGTYCRDVTPGDRDANPTSSTFSVGDDFTFSPDGSHLVFTAVPPKNEAWSTNYQLCRVSLANTKEEWEALTKNPAADVYPRFSPDGKKLAWRAQKKPGYEADKWDLQVVDCNPDGSFDRTPKNLTEQKDVSPGEFVWTPTDDLVFVADEKAMTTLFSVSLSGEIKKGLEFQGIGGRFSAYAQGKLGQVASLTTSKNGNCWSHTIAHLNGPAEVYCVQFEIGSNGSGVTCGQLSSHNDTLLATLDRPKPESIEVDIEDGKMQMWILKPPGFDPSKKWPVAYLVHGGPQGAWEDSWSYRWNPTLWAAQGYVVALPNPRGSTGFGQKFTDQISGDWGGKCYRDLMAGADYVEKLPYVDKDRIAAAGASFGGYMMDWFAVSTGRFKTLISHCSVWNFESMWGTTDELWFDEWEHAGRLPWEAPGKYREFSPHTKAENLGKFKTPMLLIQNDLDFRCPVGQGIELFTTLQRQGVPSRLINFPDEGHWVLKPANSKYWHEEVFAWLKKQAPPGPR
jgi:dipeptidyl aminopeptidase/acylaminoacyl peptidase